ncbi:MAG: hypothetical protein IK130_07500 [Oscillospiraceae bacterium]|nr:hypothetical protein [Oscillospiraceae bacterium]
MNKAFEVLDQFAPGETEDGRVYQSGVLRLSSPGIDTMTLTVMGRYTPESSANAEGIRNRSTAAFILENLGNILERAANKLLEDGLVLHLNELRPDILTVCDGVQVISGNVLDFAVKFMTEKRDEKTGAPFIHDILFHFPRSADGKVQYTLDGLMIASYTE